MPRQKPKKAALTYPQQQNRHDCPIRAIAIKFSRPTNLPLAKCRGIVYNTKSTAARGEAGYRSGFRFQRPGVRIPPGGPKNSVCAFCANGVFRFVRNGRDSNKEGERVSVRKKTVRWTVFADVGNERSEAKARLRRKIPPGGPKNPTSFDLSDFFIQADRLGISSRVSVYIINTA